MSNFYTEPFVSAGEMEFPSQPYITAQPQNHTATGPEEYILTVIAAGAVSYQWEVFDGESWSTIPGATSDTLTINIDSSMNGWRYRVLVTGADGSTIVSKAAQIAVRGVHEITLEGAIVTFTGPARITSLEVEINAVQSGSGDPSPTNIRPISGWNAVNVVRTGKNVFGGDLLKDGVLNSLPSATVDADEQTITFSASASVSVTGFNKASGLTFKEDTQYTFVLTYSKTSGLGPNMRIQYTDGTFTTVPSLADVSAKETKVVVSSPNKTVALLYKNNSSGSTILYYNESGVFEGVLTADDFEPYTGTTYPISLGQTVCGGTLEVETGVLTVTHGYIASYNGENLPSTWISDRDVYAEGTTPTIGAEVVYELATPTTIQLSATDISTLTGVNNIWADCGDVAVTIIR